MSVPFILRQYTDDDESFIYSSFLQSLHSHYPWKFVPKTLYFKPQAKVIEFLLRTSKLLVACFPEDPSEIIGWILFQPVSAAMAIHYIYVKGQWRTKRVASDIIKQVKEDNTLLITSHVCDDFGKLKYKVPNCKIIYDPFLIEKLKEIDASG